MFLRSGKLSRPASAAPAGREGTVGTHSWGWSGPRGRAPGGTAGPRAAGRWPAACPTTTEALVWCSRPGPAPWTWSSAAGSGLWSRRRLEGEHEKILKSQKGSPSTRGSPCCRLRPSPNRLPLTPPEIPPGVGLHRQPKSFNTARTSKLTPECKCHSGRPCKT